MSEIDIDIQQDTNPIEIITPTATEETEIQAEETQNNTSYNVGGDAYYTDLAKDWAIKMSGKVLGQDYSSKYYAYLAQQIEGQVAQDTEDAQIWAEGTDAQVQALGGEHSSKGWVNYVLTNPPEAYVTQTQTGCLLTVTDINGTTTAELLNGQDGQDGVDGTDGAGISSINKTSTSGLVDTYTITLSDSNTYNFTVTNGQNGAKGDKGDKGDTGNTGATGATGNGIANIAKTSTSGLVDTYTITYTNADTDNFTVTNGQNGTNGTNGTDGQDGADGFSPIATVTKSGDTATISITDKNGTTTATITDGASATVDQTYDATSVNAQSGVAIEGELTSNYQPKLTFSTGLTNTNNTITVTDYAKLIKNTATGTNSLTLLGTATGEGISINIGSSSKALGEGCVAIGADSSAGASGKGGSIAIGSGNTTSSGRFSIAMGYYAVSSADEAIQIGYGTNSTANSLNIGFYNNSTTHYNWQLLDGTTGLIPDARLSTNIARSADIPTVPTNISSFTNDSGYITGITSSDVTTALGYTPYNSSNPDGFITSAALADCVTTNTAQTISAKKTFTGEKAILFKQTSNSDKLGFTLYNSSNTELGAFEYRPNTISSNALLNINTSYSNACYVGFRYWGTAVNVIAPKPSTAGDYYIPINITDGNTTVTANNTGSVNISSLLPDISGKQNTLTAGSNITISGDTISATDTTYTAFTGCDSVTAGTSGLVPAPSAGDESKFLKADGTWDTVGGGGGASNLTDLGDVSITSAASGEVLQYDGNDWINAPKTLVTIRRWS